MRSKRLKKTSVSVARLNQLTSGRHHAVGRREEATRESEQRIRRTRVSVPRNRAGGKVTGIPVANICRENGETCIDKTWGFVGLESVHQGPLLKARNPATTPAMKLGRSILCNIFWSKFCSVFSVVLHCS